MYVPLAYYDGYCARCQDDSPLVVAEEGPRGLRAWLSGVGPEDRALSYTCRTCGLREHVPFTDSEDDEYAGTLPTWPDWDPPAPPQAAETAPEPAGAAPTVPVPDGDVFASAATRLSALELLHPPVVPEVAEVPEHPAARPPTVRVVTLPVQRVAAADGHLLRQSTSGSTG